MPGFDVKVPTSARVWNYWVGGKDNFAADRELGERTLQAYQVAQRIVPDSRIVYVDNDRTVNVRSTILKRGAAT